jgi:hypothetical protein
MRCTATAAALATLDGWIYSWLLLPLNLIPGGCG